jgi:hypothetical protein
MENETGENDEKEFGVKPFSSSPFSPASLYVSLSGAKWLAGKRSAKPRNDRLVKGRVYSNSRHLSVRFRV